MDYYHHTQLRAWDIHVVWRALLVPLLVPLLNRGLAGIRARIRTKVGIWSKGKALGWTSWGKGKAGMQPLL